MIELAELPGNEDIKFEIDNVVVRMSKYIDNRALKEEKKEEENKRNERECIKEESTNKRIKSEPGNFDAGSNFQNPSSSSSSSKSMISLGS